jgi:signal transduction histidine kinase
MVIVFALVGLAFYLAQLHVSSEARRALQSDFQAELESLHQLEDLHNAALNERCRTLVTNPRIHAALEDNALDLLYPSAKDELRDLMQIDPVGPESKRVLRARFYRFLGSGGEVLSPPNKNEVGNLDPADERAIALKKLPVMQQVGYLPGNNSSRQGTDQILAIPIFSTETGEVISALVIGFKAVELPGDRNERSLTSGIWVGGNLDLPSLPKLAQNVTARKISDAVSRISRIEGNFMLTIDNGPHLLFYKWINQDSLYPAAYEVCIYPLTFYATWERRLRWKIVIGGLLVLVFAFAASDLIARGFARPVKELALVSEQEHRERQRAEAALETTNEELERTARYSADASHQLKSPVTVLRTGLESLLHRDDFKPEVYEELSILLHQTYRLTGVIDDLLLLARMDAGKLELQSVPVNLSAVVNEWLDDLSAMPDGADLKIDNQLSTELQVIGEKHYTSLIVQNLLENARKYNRSAGKIVIKARAQNGFVILSVGNTGRAIPESMQSHLFERFRRGTNSEKVSGHGLGLNLARELAQLHGGDLRLVGSESDWTEFEVRLRAAKDKIRRAAT